MKYQAKLIITSLILIVSLNSLNLTAQSVDYNNRVEFSEDEIQDDLNSIKAISESKLKEEAREKSEITEVAEDEMSLTDLAAILDSKRLHYRNVRKAPEKCYRESEEVCAVVEE